MADYQHMYETLFNAVTETITQLQNAQKVAEDIYVSFVQTNGDNSTKDSN